MKYLAAILLLCAPPLRAAVGDILSGYVETNGWVLHVKVEGMSTNAVYNFGLGGYGSNNFTLGNTQKCRLTLNTPGFDDTGTSNWTQRSVIGTARYPFPYPDTNRFDYFEGSDVWLQIALSKPICKADGNLLLTLSNGFYVHGSTSSAAVVGLSITNNSTNEYQRVIAVNSRPDAAFAIATGATHRVAWKASHWSAQQGRSIRAAKMWATNLAGAGVTQIVTRPFVDRTYGDLSSVEEWGWDIPLSSLGSSNVVIANATFYPWHGDTNSITQTDDGTAATGKPTIFARYSPIQFFNDRLQELHQTWANVDPTNGNDGTGVAISKSSWTTNTAPFRTIRGAAKGIAATNNLLWSRNDCMGGIAWGSAGDHPWTGTNGTIGSGAHLDGWFTFTRQPIVPRAHCIISTNSSTSSPLQDLNDCVRVLDVSISSAITSAGGSIFDGIDYLLVDNCDVNTALGAAFFTLTNWALVRSTLVYARQGWAPQSVNVPAQPFIRGCIVINTNGNLFESPVMLGNWFSNNTSMQWRISTIKTAQVFTVWTENTGIMSNTTAVGVEIETRLADTGFRGALFEKNCIEGVTSPTDTGSFFSFGSSSVNSNIFNVIVRNNTLPGIKMNWFYNDAAPLRPKLMNFVEGNIIDDINIKADEFTVASGVRIGNHMALFGVGWEGNVFPETYNVGAAGTFANSARGFTGLNSYGTANTNAPEWVKFTDRKAYATATTVGRGNYRLQSSSPAFLLGPAPWTCAFDIEGAPRSAIDPPGAYSAGQRLKGVMF